MARPALTVRLKPERLGIRLTSPPFGVMSSILLILTWLVNRIFAKIQPTTDSFLKERVAASAAAYFPKKQYRRTTGRKIYM